MVVSFTRRSIVAGLCVSALPRGANAVNFALPGRLTPSPGKPYWSGDQVAKSVIGYGPCGHGREFPIYNGSWGLYDILSGPSDQVGLTLELNSDWVRGSQHDLFVTLVDGAPRLGSRLWDAEMLETEAQLSGGTTTTTGTSPATWLRPDAAFDGSLSQGYATGARIFPSNSGYSGANYLGRTYSTPHRLSRVRFKGASDNNLFGRGSSSPSVPCHVRLFGSNSTDLNFLTNSFIDVSMTNGDYVIPNNFSNQHEYITFMLGFEGDSSYSLNVAEIQFFERVAPVTRRLTYHGGRSVNDAAMTLRLSGGQVVTVAAYCATHVGSLEIDPAQDGVITCHSEYGTDRRWGLCNAQNQERVVVRAGKVTPNLSAYAVSNQRWAAMQGGGHSLRIHQTMERSPLQVRLSRAFFNNSIASRKAYEFGIGVDSTLGYSGIYVGNTQDVAGQANGYPPSTARVTIPPEFGSRTYHGIERVDGGGGTLSAFVDQRGTVLEAEFYA